jgi:Zn-dependent peptidase ImmA (M78 family)
METTLDKIENATSGAPVNIEALIRSFGIELDKKAELDPDISGQIERIGDSFKISVNKADHYLRQRFTMAHELGHFVLHRDLIGNGVDDNRAYRSAPGGSFWNRQITQRHETEANRFAANILMPEKLVIEQHELCHGDLKEVAKRFQVSSQAMKIVLDGLGLTTK